MKFADGETGKKNYTEGSHPGSQRKPLCFLSLCGFGSQIICVVC